MPVALNRSSAETKPPHENPPIRRYLQDTGKSPFVWDCVVGSGGLEPSTNWLWWWGRPAHLADPCRLGAHEPLLLWPEGINTGFALGVRDCADSTSPTSSMTSSKLTSAGK
jgi:hypothetical protein